MSSQLGTQPPTKKRKVKSSKGFDSLKLLKWAVVVFFFLFLVLPLLSVFIVSFTGEPVTF